MLALSALLAHSKAEASAIAGAVLSTASVFNTADKDVPSHGGGTAKSQKPNTDSLALLASLAVSDQL